MKKKEVDEWMRWLSETGARKTLLSVLEEEFCGSISPAERHAAYTRMMSETIRAIPKKQEGEEA